MAVKLGCCLPGGSFMPQGVASTGSAPLDSLIAGCALVTGSGFDYAEATVGSVMALTDEETGRAAAEGLQIEYYNSFIPGKYRILAVPDGYSAALDFVKSASQRVKALGGRLIVLGSGAARAVPEGMDAGKAKEIFTRFCAEAAEIMREFGLTLALEPLNASECNFINTLAEGAEIVERVDAPNFGLLCDAYHMYRAGEEPDDAAKYADMLCHVHVAEPPERVYPGKNGGAYLRALAAAMKDAGYRGGVTAECSFGVDKSAEFSAAHAFMAEIFGL